MLYIRYIDGTVASKTKSYNYSVALNNLFKGCDYHYDIIFNEDIHNITISNKRFYSCIFDDIDFTDLKCINVQFVNCTFRNCKFTGCNFDKNSTFDRCDFIGDCRFKDNKGLNEYTINPNMILKDCTRTIQALKMVTKDYSSPIYLSKIKYEVGGVIEVSKINEDPEETCGAGLHVATLPWIKRNWQQGSKILLVEFSPKDIIIPYSSEGKYRVRKLKVVKELDPKKYGLK